MTFLPRARTLTALIALTAGALRAQSSAFDFSIKNIMRGPEVFGREPTQIRWSPDGQWIYFQWLPAGSDWRDPLRPFRVRAQGGVRPEPVTEAHMDSIGPALAAGAWSTDHARRAVEFRGDLYLIDGATGAARRLTETNSAESVPRFSSDAKRVIFVRDGNGFSMELATGFTRQLTDIRPAGTAGNAAAPATPQRGALAADQRRLFEVIRDQMRADSMRRADAREPSGPKSITLNAGERVSNVSVSPSGTAVLFTTTTAAADQRTVVPNYVTSTGFTEDIPSRAKVGDAQPVTRIGFQLLPRGDVQWLKTIDSDTAVASGTIVGWNDAGTAALIVASARNFKTRQISTVDAATGALKAIEVLRDTAWVAGPCGFGCVGFYDQDRRIYYVSEATGYAQLWSTAADGSDRKALTSGRWEIYDVALSNDRQSFHFHSSEVSAFDKDLYRMSIAGGARTKLTSGAGGHQAVLSPNETLLADVYSTVNRPPELFVATPGAAGAQRTVSPTADWLAFNWIKPELVFVPASDGAQVPAHIYRPKDVGAKSNGAAVIFVHGAGYLHNVGHFWSGYPREYMFNQYLAAKGYVVIDLDYRASAGYGRDWRTAIYRWMGGRDLQDQVDASVYLTRQYGIAPERIGMYGGSYGGFMTLMALFTAPKYFGAGAALRPVTDWAHYNHGYTGSILNLPQNDSLAYRRSSPIFLAEGLEDPLLILHGMVDTNVHFEDSVRLTQRLIELGKTGWSITPYPVEDHGFTRPSSWADEYTRIFDLFESTIGPKGTKGRR